MTRRRYLFTCVLVAELMLAACGPGTPDDSFGGDGIANMHVDTIDVGLGGLVTPTGRTVIAGYSGPDSADTSATLARLRADGSVDNSFGTGGRVVGEAGHFLDVARTMDNKYLAVGWHLDGADVFWMMVSRYLANGDPDDTFFAGGNTVLHRPAAHAWGTSIEIDHNDPANPNDDDLWIAGAAGASIVDFDPFVWKLQANGTLDPTFDGTGFDSVATATSTAFKDLALDEARGRVIAVGGGVSPVNNSGFAAAGFFTTAFDVDGGLDPTFNGGAPATLFTNGWATSLYVRPDGRAVVTGVELRDGGLDRVRLVRYTTGGALDASFGVGGIVRQAIGADVRAQRIERDASGRMVVAGIRVDGGFAMFAARFNAGGTLDTSFGGSGWAATPDDGRGWGLALTDTTVTVIGDQSPATGRANFSAARWLA